MVSGGGCLQGWVAETSNACPIFYLDEDGDNKQQGQAHFTLLTPLPLSA